jgi:diguanylate cyclase (GGDEF)-like protein
VEIPKIPVDEEERLFHLKAAALLDTPAEERFERVTRMARRLFGAPIALVSLIDTNRQWFKSHNGLDIPETSRDVSFCAHAILEQDVFVVEDALKDERFHDNPLVTGDPNIRFYAGQQLRPFNGKAIGTLCIIDRTPREFSVEDRQLLVDLAQVIEREMSAIQLSTLDELTRMSNRRGFLALARPIIEVCKREQSEASLVFFDLDKFKEINDTHGHAEGDKALKIFSEALRSAFRASNLYARLSGDEFVALLPNTSATAAQSLISRLNSILQISCNNFDLKYALQFSYGIVVFDSMKHVTIEDMLQEADTAMYEHKASKRRRTLDNQP